MYSLIRYLKILFGISILVLISGCGKEDLGVCIDDHIAARNSYPLVDDEDGRDKQAAIQRDLKYGKCFVQKLGINREKTKIEMAQKVLDYTSTTIVYVKDQSNVSASSINRPGTRLPSRTVVDGKGDCEDKSVLAAVMLKELNIPTYIIHRPPIKHEVGHIFLGVVVDYKTQLTCGNVNLLAFDPTLKNAKLGDVEDGLKLNGKFRCGLI